MFFGIDIIKKVYKCYPKRVFETRQIPGKLPTLPESHILNLRNETLSHIVNEVDYVVTTTSRFYGSFK